MEDLFVYSINGQCMNQYLHDLCLNEACQYFVVLNNLERRPRVGRAFTTFCGTVLLCNIVTIHTGAVWHSLLFGRL